MKHSFIIKSYSSTDGPMIVDMRYINYREGCGQVICVSSGSPATRVMWSENGKPLDADISLSHSSFQVITDRAAAVYRNVLVVRDMVVGSNYSCTVTNDLGSSSMDIIVNSGEIFSHNLKENYLFAEHSWSARTNVYYWLTVALSITLASVILNNS